MIYGAYSYFMQTLTSLNLSSNEIGEAGAKHLADVLKGNNVSAFDSLLFS